MLGGKEKQQQQLEAYQARISREPEDLEAHDGIVTILALQGKPQEAKAHLEKFRTQFVAEGKFHLVQLLDQAIASMNRYPHSTKISSIPTDRTSTHQGPPAIAT